MKTLNILRTGSLAALGLLLVAGCEKKPNKAPEADKELQSSVDVSYANLVISDIDMICSFVGENTDPKFYMHVTEPGNTPVDWSRTQSDDYVFVAFNNTKCLDGHVRNGTIAMSYARVNPNARYYRDFEFKGEVALINYRVDGWRVELNNVFKITNQLPVFNFDPKTTPLSWKMTGDFTLKHPTDASKNMHCNVDLLKTLANTSNPAVFAPSRQSAINWSLSVVEYKGSVFGETSANIPFTYEVNENNPLVRDFGCFPDKVAAVSVVSGSVNTRYEEFHPFTKGLASFTTDHLYPRQIAYGNEADGNARTAAQCDNTGIVTIKGILYPVDFKKEYK